MFAFEICINLFDDHPKMALPGGTPYFDCFWYFSTHNYVKNSRTIAVKSQMIEELYVFTCATII